MSALPKYEDLYKNNDKDLEKKEVEEVKEKITQLLNSKSGQKKAAQILEMLLNKK